MSHGIENEREAVFANTPAWHKLGTVFKPGERDGMLTGDVEKIAPTIFAERKLLTTYASLNGPLNLADPLTMFGPTDLLDGGKIRFIARTDGENAKIHGIAGKGYRIWQVREAFAFLDGLVSEGKLQYESVFALGGGDAVVMVCRLPGKFTVGRTDQTLQYLMVKVTFTGKDSIVMVPTFVRVVCANTVAMAISSAESQENRTSEPVIFRMRHTAGLDVRLAQARKHIARFDEALEAEATLADTLASKVLNQTATERFIAEMFPLKDEDGAPLEGRPLATRERKVEILRESWKVERDSFWKIGEQNMIDSAWHMLQAVTRAVDHLGLDSKRGTDRARAERTYLSAVEGDGAALKLRARDLLLV